MIGYWCPIARNLILTLAVLSLTACAGIAEQDEDGISEEAELAEAAAEVVSAQMDEPPDQRIPSELLAEARCIAVFPSVIKGGLVVGVKRGGGLISCRGDTSAEWTDTVPGYFKITGASIGLQAGVQSTKLILLVMDAAGVNQILSGNVTLGADIGVVAGPVGFDVEFSSDAPIVAYSRSKGLFAGINLGGSTISYDGSSNADVYGQRYNEADAARDLLLGGGVSVPAPVSVYNQALAGLTAQ